MAEALKASNDENRRLWGMAKSFDSQGYLRFSMVMGCILFVVCFLSLKFPKDPTPPLVTCLPSVTPPPVPEVDRCCRMWTLVHGADDIHVEDGTGEIVVGFEYLTRALDVPEDMERLSGRQIRRVLWFAQELVDAHNQDVE